MDSWVDIGFYDWVMMEMHGWWEMKKNMETMHTLGFWKGDFSPKINLFSIYSSVHQRKGLRWIMWRLQSQGASKQRLLRLVQIQFGPRVQALLMWLLYGVALWPSRIVGWKHPSRLQANFVQILCMVDLWAQGWCLSASHVKPPKL